MKIVFILIGSIIVLFSSSCTTNEGAFELKNKTNELILRASVSICGQTIDFKNIKPGKSGKGSFKVKTDSHYIIWVEFESGKSLEKETGYVTHGMKYSHKITVTSSDIEITDTKFN